MSESSLAHRSRSPAALWKRSSPGVRDAYLAILLTVATQVELVVADTVDGPIVVQSVSFALMTIAVAWRRTIPVLAAALVATGLAAQTLAGTAEIVGGFIALLVVTYSVASYSAVREAAIGGALILAAVFIYPLVNDLNFADEVGNVMIFVGTWTLGRVVRTRQVRAVEAESRAHETEVARDAAVRAAISDERDHIARDLHDVVAHGVSLMVLQAGAARNVLEADRDQARELLLGVEAAGRQALDEMHRMLEILRADGERGDDASQASIRTIERLIEDVTSTGLSVEYRLEGESRDLPVGLELSAYRIVQEALTNSVKHADASSAAVTIVYEADCLRISVTDDGAGQPDKPSTGSGRGLIGMRERAQLFGGSMHAGPIAPGPGWVVTARLPIEAPA